MYGFQKAQRPKRPKRRRFKRGIADITVAAFLLTGAGVLGTGIYQIGMERQIPVVLGPMEDYISQQPRKGLEQTPEKGFEPIPVPVSGLERIPAKDLNRIPAKDLQQALKAAPGLPAKLPKTSGGFVTQQIQDPLKTEALLAWEAVKVIRPEATLRRYGKTKELGQPLLPVFFEPSTFFAAPMIASAQVSFIVMVDSDETERYLRARLDRLKVLESQYLIWRLDLQGVTVPEAFELIRERMVYYEIYRVDPAAPNWLAQLRQTLEVRGILFENLSPALEATRRYFQAYRR